MLVTWFIFQIWFNRRYALAGAIILGVAAGFRPDMLVFLGPFWFYATTRIDRRLMLLSWAALVAVVLAWLAPLIYLAGGITAYHQISNYQYIVGVRPSSVFGGGFGALLTNAGRVRQAVFWMFGPACIGLLYPAGMFLLPKSLRGERTKAALLLALMLPTFAFFLMFVFDPLGYLLVYVTPLLLLVARGFTVGAEALDRLIAGRRWKLSAGMALVGVFLALTSTANIYLFTQASRINWRLPTTGPLSTIFGTYSAGGIQKADELTVSLPENAQRILLLEKHPFQDVSAAATQIYSTGTNLFASIIEIPPDGRLQIGRYGFNRQFP